jgi:uncharacterized protein YegL
MITPKKKAKKTPTKARILFIIDRSGSMSCIKDETIGGFNAFLKEQKSLPGKATVSLVQFDHEYLVTHDNVPIQDVPELNGNTFQPRGYTALYDAVGRTIASLKDDNPKNTKTIVAILTDGAENASKEYTYSKVKELITEVEGQHGWEVLFLGTNMDAGRVGAQMGVKVSNSVTFDYTKAGAMDAMSAVNFATTASRGVSLNSRCYADGSAITAANLDMSKLYNDVKNKSIVETPDKV